MSTEWSELSEAESQAETVRVVAEEALNPVAARYAAMDLLARREHLQRELETKLLKRFSELPDAREVIAEVVAKLTAENLQSDERFCEAYVSQRSARGYGPDRIQAELSQKGAADSLAEHALATCEVDWGALAQQVRVKKFGAELPTDWPAKSKQLRFLQYRGFSGDQLSLLDTGGD
jgi:regulatory protein